MATSIEQYKELLRINREDLDTDVARHAVYFGEICEEYERLVSLRDEAESAMNAHFAAKCIEVREEATEKITKDEVEARVVTSAGYMKLSAKHSALKKEVGQWSALIKAWTARGSMLKVVADLHGQQYWSKSSLRSDAGDHVLNKVRKGALNKKLSFKK